MGFLGLIVLVSPYFGMVENNRQRETHSTLSRNKTSTPVSSVFWLKNKFKNKFLCPKLQVIQVSQGMISSAFCYANMPPSCQRVMVMRLFNKGSSPTKIRFPGVEQYAGKTTSLSLLIRERKKNSIPLLSAPFSLSNADNTALHSCH